MTIRRHIGRLGAAALMLGVAACSTARAPESRLAAAPDRGAPERSAPQGPGLSTPAPRSVATGVASWYGPGFHGNLTANGEIFDQTKLTAAHRTLPLPSLARVTRLDTGESVVVRVNDRGPYAGDRIIDLSRAAAAALGFIEDGVTEVRVEALGPADPHDRAARAQFFDPAEGPPRGQAPLGASAGE
ncbi:hypothetical protein DDZ18_05675 [Marinicauda salina]|uniref:Endolytic peptidoglycan transglycosylase RlpA n=1 Tax=Marinicauda salina TaxID=2135793 RepID=A0A2U2BT51_9PROT|nr:septal ring lytic transglycosylase RlpA family protein [Marinicauda salina]PWE17184.1 hypothetical protein DDZ18_05675 [Marinicauda salina]